VDPWGLSASEKAGSTPIVVTPGTQLPDEQTKEKNVSVGIAGEGIALKIYNFTFTGEKTGDITQKGSSVTVPSSVSVQSTVNLQNISVDAGAAYSFNTTFSLQKPYISFSGPTSTTVFGGVTFFKVGNSTINIAGSYNTSTGITVGFTISTQW
jgi:hypothetical protein